MESKGCYSGFEHLTILWYCLLLPQGIAAMDADDRNKFPGKSQEKKGNTIGHVIPHRVERKQETEPGSKTRNKTHAGTTGMPQSETAAALEATKTSSHTCTED